MCNDLIRKFGVWVGVLMISVLLSSAAHCETVAIEPIPQIVKDGLMAYKSAGPDAAIKAWIKGSPYENSKEALSQANVFKQIETFYGPYVGYHLIAILPITPSVKMVYFSMNFESGPVFAKFMIYEATKGWYLSGKFNFNTEPEVVLPKWLLRENMKK